jgi:predicted small lipoprotein YifL
MKKILLFIIFILLAGCGRKGALVPPEALVPAPIADLAVSQRGDNFVVSWSQPGKEEGGASLKGLAGFQLFRREVLPPAEDCEDCPTAYRLVKSVDLEFPQGIARSGGSFTFVDTEITEGTTYQYKVISTKRDGSVSKVSNRVRLKRVRPPVAPVVKLVFTPYSAELSWEPIKTLPGEEVTGYRVFRRNGGDAPLEPVATLTGTAYEDNRLEPGKDYGYSVTSMVKVGDQVVESGFSPIASGRLAPPE